MATLVKLSDGSRAHHLRVDDPERTERGDYIVRITSDDDTQGHMLSVAMAVDGYLKVSARDARAMRVEVHDVDKGRRFKAIPETTDDVSGHSMQEHEWQLSQGSDDVQGSGMSNDEITSVTLGAATALVAMLHAEEAVHTAAGS